MFSWKEFEKLKAILSQTGGNNYRSENGQHHIYARPGTLLEWMEFLKEDLGFFTLLELSARDLGQSSFEIVYQLLNMGTHQRTVVHVLVHGEELIPSVESFFANANWSEREQSEMFPLNIDRHQESLILPEEPKVFPLLKNAKIPAWKADAPMKLPELRYNPNKSEAPYPEESYVWKSFGIQDAETLGKFELLLCFDPHKVVDLKSRIGFYHQGFEKLLESKDIVQILQLVDKLNLSASPSASISWAKTVEEMFRIKIPERAQAIRIVLLELSRMADHLTVLASVCMESRMNEATLLIDAREKIYELFEKFSGHRQGVGSSRLGGVRDDLPPGWIVEYQRVAEVLNRHLKTVNNSLLSQQKFKAILNGEPVSAQSVIQWGISGPAMRASGLNFDLRKSQPFYFYQDIDFDIPVGIAGTAYDRYLIRFEEIHQSLRIITQVIDNLPLGEYLAKEVGKNYLELSQHFETLSTPREWHYSSIEAPSGELGYLVRFQDKLLPTRLKMKTPGFNLAQGLKIFLAGLRQDQVAVNIASLGLSRFEMDR